EFILSLDSEGPIENEPAMASVEDIEQEASFRFGKQKFFCTELEAINRCAYSDYQRDRVYLRTCPSMRTSLRRKERADKKKLRVNEEVECQRPDKCPACGGSQIHSFGRMPSRKVVFDLKCTSSGVKRWLTRYSSLRYRCWKCKTTFNADSYRSASSRVGNALS